MVMARSGGNGLGCILKPLSHRLARLPMDRAKDFQAKHSMTQQHAGQSGIG